MNRWILAVLVAALYAPVAAAQGPDTTAADIQEPESQRPRGPGFSYGAAVWGAGAQARSVYPGGAEALQGPVLGFDIRVRRGRVGLRVGYGQGKLNPDTAGPEVRTYIDGFVHLTGAITQGLELGVGPYARAYGTDAGTQRWLFWQLRARYETGIVGPVVRGFAEIWIGVSGTVNVAESLDGSRGGAAGVMWHVADWRNSPLTLRLSYIIDEARLGSGARRETVERTSLSIGLGRQ